MSIQGKIYTSFVMALNRLAKAVIKSDKEYGSISDINLEEVKSLKKQYGIGGIILDVDGTIIKDMEHITKEAKKCLQFLNQEFKIYLVSNNKDKRISKVAQELGIGYIPLAVKPKRKPFLKASEKMGLEPENIIVIGDGFLTDILGGKRSGMYTATVKHVEIQDVDR